MQGSPDRFEGEEREEAVRLRATYQDYAHAASRPGHAALVSDRMVERYAVAGDTSEVAERLGALLAHPRLDRIVLTPQGGSATLEEVLRTLEKHVLPKLGSAVG
jgi:alkanesulfonate monooxygenase SsuD/methylene tetrahydromethanopterin reductase-like flavin-dependent oxidoreductase (luciferase family)